MNANGWYAPDHPGPSRRMIAVGVGLAVACALAWAVGPTGQLGRWTADSEREPVVIELADDGGTAVVHAGKRRVGPRVRLWSRGGFAAARLAMPDTRPDVAIEVVPPPGMVGSDLALRVESDGARVRVDRDRDDRPRARIEGRRDDVATHVTVTYPADTIDTQALQHAGQPLRTYTARIDAVVQRQRGDSDRLTDIRRWAWLLAAMSVIGGTAPLLLWLRARRRFLRAVGPPASRAPARREATAEGAPGGSVTFRESPAIAASRVRGVGVVDLRAAFVATVYSLVARGEVRARRVADGERTGVAMVLRQGARGCIRPHEAAAFDLVHTVYPDADDGDPSQSAFVPDMPTCRPDEAEPAMKAKPATAAELATSHFSDLVAAEVRADGARERPDRRALAALAAGGPVLAVAGVASGSAATSVSAEALWWLLAAVFVPMSSIAIAGLRDLSSWMAVPRAGRAARQRLLEQLRSVRTDDGLRDPGSESLRLAMGLPTASIPLHAEAGATGCDAYARATISALGEAFSPPDQDGQPPPGRFDPEALGGTLLAWLPRKIASAPTSPPPTKS